MAGIFAGIKAAKGGGNQNYLLAGNHDLRILTCRKHDGWQKKVSFIVEFEVISSSTLPPRSRWSWVVKLDPTDEWKFDRQLADIKSFLATATDTEVEQIDEDDVATATSAENPLAGIRIRSISTDRTREGKSPFTVHSWMPSEASAA